MSTVIPDNLKPLYVRAKRRGLKELDIVLGFVADTYLLNMKDEQIVQFKEFLSQEDSDLFKWIMSTDPIPKHLDNEIWAMVKSFKPTETNVIS